MKVLIGFEYSGITRDAFKNKGHDSWSCDLLPTEKPGNHIQADIRIALEQKWDLAIFHPPCTYLSKACSWRWKDTKEEIQKAIELIELCWNQDINKICIENPPGYLNYNWKRPNDIVEPYNFGDPWKKQTCLWLKNLPPLLHTGINIKKPFIRFTGHGKQPSEIRQKLRSKSFEGIAEAMANQWG